MLGGDRRGWINQLKEHKRTFTNILKLSSHHAVNTENKGGKDELCFGGNRGGAVVELCNRGSFIGRRAAVSLTPCEGSRRRSDAAARVVLRVESKGRRWDRIEAFCHRRKGGGGVGGSFGGTGAQFKSPSSGVRYSTPFPTARHAPRSRILYRKDATRHLGCFGLFFRASPSSSYLQSPASLRLSCPRESSGC